MHAAPLASGLRRVVLLGRTVRFSHTVFALPFALAGVLLAHHVHAVSPGLPVWGWVVAAMVGARTAAMAMNRLADAEIDARNPRTRNRELPVGAVSRRAVTALLVGGAALFVVAARMLNPLCFALSPLALAVVLGYSFTKRFTWTSHFILGLGLAMAPVGGWLAVTGRMEIPPFLVGAAVLTWIAGLDMLYALQDESFDRTHGLHSVPQRFGRSATLRLAALCHGVTVVLLAVVQPVLGLSPWYLAGVLVGAGLLVVEHRVAAGDLARIEFAAFDMNGLFSVTILTATALGVWL